MKKLSIIAISLAVVFSFYFFTVRQAETTAVIDTDYGKVTVKLYEETPMHKENFVKLCKDKLYDGVLFHRVIREFMVQTGDPSSKNATAGSALGSGGPGYTVPAEIKAKYFHKKGALAAARLGDNINPMKESSGSQFYIVVGKKWTNDELNQMEMKMNTKFSAEQRKIYTSIGGTPHLDMTYTVFGEVIDGMKIIDSISKVAVDPRSRPIKDIKVKSVRIQEKKGRK